MASVTIYAPSLTTYGYNAFGNSASGPKIYVFSDCVNTYKARWSDYSSKIEAIVLAVNDAGNSSGKWTTYYNALTDVTVSAATIYKAAISGDKSKVVLTEVAGSVVKRGEAVLLNSADAIELLSAASSGSGDYSGNDLKGGTTVTTGYDAYTLSRGSRNTKGTVLFVYQ